MTYLQSRHENEKKKKQYERSNTLNDAIHACAIHTSDDSSPQSKLTPLVDEHKLAQDMYLLQDLMTEMCFEQFCD